MTVMTGSGRTAVRPLVLALTGFVFLLGSLLTTVLQADESDAEADDADKTPVQSEEEARETDRPVGTGAFGGNNTASSVKKEA